MKRVAILLLNNVFDSAFTILHDVLRTASRLGAIDNKSTPFSSTVISVNGRPVRSGSGQMLNVAGSLNTISQPDLIVIPGLELLDGVAIETFLAQKFTKTTILWLQKHFQKGCTIAACCTSTFLVAQAGLLNRRLATTSWWYAEEFQRRYPQVNLQQDMMITQEPNLICGGAAMAHMDLALTLLDRLVGPALSHEVAQYLLLDGRSSQARYVITGHLAQSNEDTRRAEAWIREHIRQSISVQNIATGLGVGARTLSRRIQESIGQTPHQFVQRLKIERAIYLLETTDWSFETITEETGYKEPASLRRLIRKHTGRTPSNYRKPNRKPSQPMIQDT